MYTNFLKPVAYYETKCYFFGEGKLLCKFFFNIYVNRKLYKIFVCNFLYI